MSREKFNAYSKADITAAFKLLNIHLLKLGKAIDADNFAEACTAIRAIEDECENAVRIAAVLSFHSRNTSTIKFVPRMGHGANTGAFENGSL